MRFACVLAVVLACSVTHAAPQDAAARLTAAAKDHYERAEQFYKAEQYEAARIEFQAGYELSKNPVFLWNLAKVSEKIGERQIALDFAQRYRATLTEPDPEVDDFLKSLSSPAGPGKPSPVAPVPPAARQSVNKKRSPAPWILLGVGAALLIADIGVAAAGYQLTQSNDGAMVTMDELAELNARGGRLNAAGWSLLGVGLGSAAAGGIWLVVRR